MEVSKLLQEWCREVWEDNCFSESKLDLCKAYGAAVLSGAIDGAVFLTAYTITVGLLRKLIKK